MKLSQAFQIKQSENIALIGGGGKSSALFRLGQELADEGKRVLLTTTTRIFAAQIAQAQAHLTFNPTTQSFSELVARLGKMLAQHNQILLIGQAEPRSGNEGSTGKAAGLPPEIIDQLVGLNLFDVIINEADGSRMRPFKAPAEHEPVIPASTSLVIPVVGLDVLGQPLNEQAVHRPERVAQLSATPLNAPITPQTVAAVITHPQGGLKNIPTSARVIPFLNKLDTSAPTQAKTLARLLLQNERVDSVVVGATAQTEAVAWVENRVQAVILAAGGATRFGSPKQLALWRGKPLLAHAVDTALQSDTAGVTVILGANAPACREILGNRPLNIIVNSAWEMGQSTSMQAGLKMLSANSAAVLFLLADQPLLKPETINQIISRFQQTLAPVVWPTYKGKRGNPVLFSRALFSEMAQIQGDVGAKPVLLAHQHQAQTVAVNDPGILLDIDRPEDLAEG